MLSLLTVVTAAVLAVIVVMVRDMAGTPAAGTPTALAATAPVSYTHLTLPTILLV